MQCNSKSITLFGYQPGQLGSNTDYDSVSSAVVQMEKTTGENEAICKTTPKKGMVLRWWPQTICLSSSFLADFWLVLDFASALTTRGSMRRYLQPTEVAQVVLLIQDGTSMRTVARRFAESPSTVSRAWRRYQETGQYTRRHGGGPRRTTTQPQDHYLVRRSTASAQQNDFQQATNVNVSAQTVRNRLHDCGMRARRPQVGPVLTAQHRGARLTFARVQMDWAVPLIFLSSVFICI